MSRAVHRTAIAAATALGLAATSVFAQSDLERRVDRLEQRLEGSALMSLMNEADALRGEVTALRGEIEVLERELRDIRGQQRSLYLDLDERLQALETGAAGDGSGDADAGLDGEAISPDLEIDADLAGAAGDDEGDADSDAGADAAQADIRSAYDEAFGQLRDGDHEAAAEQFEAFLEAYPDADLAANARYWLGESHYVERDFDNALTEFQRVLDDYPESNKRPDAMLKIGYVHLEQGREDEARAALEAVVDEYADTTAANLAQQRLDQL